MLKGNVKIPPSKSIAHRALICASLSKKPSKIENIAFSEDTKATIDACIALGASIRIDKNTLYVEGNTNSYNDKTINCRESGSTLRFIIPISLDGNKVTFIGGGRLVKRPLGVYYDIFDKQNISYENDNGNLPLSVYGKLKSGKYSVPGDVSSQFVTGLLFALPKLEKDSVIVIENQLESKGYIDITLDILKKYGIKIENNNYKTFYIKGNQEYKSKNIYVEGDYSQAAFFLVAGLLGEEVTVTGIDKDSKQGDRVIVDILRKMGGNIEQGQDYIKAKKSKTHGMVLDCKDCPDLVPILAVLASLSSGTTEIINSKRLRYKESDRISDLKNQLCKLGAKIEEREDGLVIHGREFLDGGMVSSINDHRLAMAFSIASIKCRKNIIIENKEAINKSYPNFFQDFKSLGGDIIE